MKILELSGGERFTRRRNGPGKNDHVDVGIFYAVFLALKFVFCPIFIEYGIIEEKTTFRGIEYAKRLLDR